MNGTIPMDPSRETLLDLKLEHLARELAHHSAPSALEATLAARFRSQATARRPAFWWIPPLALAAAVMLVTWIVRAPATQQPAEAPAATAAAPADADGPFLALRPLERIALDGTTVVETQFPRALLAGWGLPVAPERAAEPVRAQMLYSAEGEPLAVRIVR
jgi:hypothetical protein